MKVSNRERWRLSVIQISHKQNREEGQNNTPTNNENTPERYVHTQIKTVTYNFKQA